MAQRGRNKSKAKTQNGATVGYEAQLWQMADALRGSMDAAEYKHVVLGLIFLKYISDAFEEQHARLQAERAQGADPEDPDEYRAHNIFWVPAGKTGGKKREAAAEYQDIPGFCKSATLEEIRKHGHVLTPGRYVGAEAQEDDLPAPRPGCFFVYAIRCDDDSIYIGHSDNLRRRWNEHCAGQGADWTKSRKPIRIVHYEEYASREEAVTRERELKTTNGRRWLKEEIAAGRVRQAGGEPFPEKMKRLVATLREQQAEAAPSLILSRIGDEGLLGRIREELRESTQAWILSAFYSPGILNLLLDDFRRFIETGGDLRILLSTMGNITRPEHLTHLNEFVPGIRLRV